MKRELYDAQKVHAGVLMRALQNYNAALDGSATGCGKTLVGAEIACQLDRPTFVVGLKGSLPMWEKEMTDRGHPALGVINYEKLRTGKTPWGKWEGRKIWQWNLPTDALILWDEVQSCQGFDTLNSKMLIGSKRFTNLMMSATAAQDPTDMRASGYILGLHNLRDCWAWCRKNGCHPGAYGGLEFGGQLNVDYDEILARLHHEIFPRHGSRLSVADLADHFQETQIITTPLEFGEDIKRLYAEMQDELNNLAQIMTGDSDHPAAQALVAKLRARQQVELCKVPLMIQMTEDLLREGRSVPIFVNFEATIQALNKRLVGAKIISGKAKEPRHEVERAFQADECRLVICNTQAGGVSLNLHDIHGNYPRTAIISPDWNAKKILQTIGRVHRAGGKTPSQQHVLFAAGTVEEEVKDAVEAGMRNIGIINEGKSDSMIAKIINQRNVVDVDPALCEDKSPVTKEKTPAAALPEKEHAEFNPSSLAMFEKCPGFRNRNEETEQSKKGTRIHHALEKNLIDELHEDERPIAQRCQNFLDQLIADHLPKLPDKDYREIMVHIDLGADLTTFGTCDRLLIYGDYGYMIDFKSGFREITDAEQNAQGFAYVIGAFQKFPQLQKIEFTFLIPSRDEISYHEFTRADLPEMILRLNTIIRRAMADDPETYNPQPELCEYCSRQATCPKLTKKALPILQKLTTGLPVPTEVLVDATRPEDIPKLLRLAPLMEEWAKGVRAAALRLNLEDGIDIAGFNRFEKSTPRSITSVLGAWDIVKAKGVTFEEFLTACGKVSAPDLDDLVSSKAGKGKKGMAVKELANDLKHADLVREQGKVFYLREAKR